MQFPLTAEKRIQPQGFRSKAAKILPSGCLCESAAFSLPGKAADIKFGQGKKQTQTVQQAAANIEALHITRLQVLQHRALFACKTGHSLYFPLHPQRYPSSPNSCFFKKITHTILRSADVFPSPLRLSMSNFDIIMISGSGFKKRFVILGIPFYYFSAASRTRFSDIAISRNRNGMQQTC